MTRNLWILLLVLCSVITNAQIFGGRGGGVSASGLTDETGVAYVPYGAPGTLSTSPALLFYPEAVLEYEPEEVYGPQLTLIGGRAEINFGSMDGGITIGATRFHGMNPAEQEQYAAIETHDVDHIIVLSGQNKVSLDYSGSSVGIGGFPSTHTVLQVRGAATPTYCAEANAILDVVGGPGACSSAGALIWLQGGAGGDGGESAGGNGGDITIRSGDPGPGTPAGRAGKISLLIGDTGSGLLIDEDLDVTIAGTVQAQDVQLAPGAAARPSCDATTRGKIWQTFGGAGVADTVAVCAKDSANAYAWRTIY